MGLDVETSADVVLVHGEIKRWRDVINIDEEQPAWPILLQLWQAAGLKLDETLGIQLGEEMEELFVKPGGVDREESVPVVKEEKEEEAKLRMSELEEQANVEPQEVTRGMIVEVPAKEWG